MSWPLIIFGAVFGAAFIIAGRAFHSGKGWRWINTTGDKAVYDKAAVLNCVAKLCYAIAASFGGCTLLAGVFDEMAFFYIGIAAALVICVATLVHLNKSQEFLK